MDQTGPAFIIAQIEQALDAGDLDSALAVLDSLDGLPPEQRQAILNRALIFAVRRFQLAAVQAFLRRGADPDITCFGLPLDVIEPPTSADWLGESLLYYAAILNEDLLDRPDVAPETRGLVTLALMCHGATTSVFVNDTTIDITSIALGAMQWSRAGLLCGLGALPITYFLLVMRGYAHFPDLQQMQTFLSPIETLLAALGDLPPICLRRIPTFTPNMGLLCGRMVQFRRLPDYETLTPQFDHIIDLCTAFQQPVPKPLSLAQQATLALIDSGAAHTIVTRLGNHIFHGDTLLELICLSDHPPSLPLFGAWMHALAVYANDHDSLWELIGLIWRHCFPDEPLPTRPQ